MNVSSPLDPIDALAAHFQSSGRRSTEKHGTLQLVYHLPCIVWRLSRTNETEFPLFFAKTSKKSSIHQKGQPGR